MKIPAPGFEGAILLASPRLPTLAGWRAVSIITVLGAHTTVTQGFPARLLPLFTWLFDGSLGVRFFFVISGFLITWLMLVEGRRNGTVNLKHFYVRRALRILPVYAAFFVVLLVLQMSTTFHLNARSWFGNLTFTTNIVGSASWTNGHLWSLAEEEQFYLLWPALFVLSSASTRMRTAALILAVPILACPVIRVLGYLRKMPPIFYRGMGITFSDSLAVGCAAAILFMNQREGVEQFIAHRRLMVMSVGAGLILIPYFLTRLLILGLFTVPLGESIQAVGFSMLLLTGICHPDFSLFRVLKWRWICEVGALSYSIYIWQQIFCSKPSSFGPGHPWCLSFLGWLVAAFSVAFVSYYALERPLFGLRKHFRE